jgi:oleandomycin transport system ATP-binding protein
VIDHGKVIAHGTAAELKRVVGGQTVLVRPAEAARLGEAAAILAAVAGRPAESPGRDVATVPVDGDAAFTDIVRRLDAAGIAVTELSLRLPSLDEAFFTLTGHHTNKQEAA